jgi:hypothetical protein
MHPHRTIQKGVLVAVFFAAVLWPTLARAISLKNFRELAAFYSVATAVPLTEPTVKQTYQNVKARLPLRGTVDEFSSVTLLASLDLGGAFCKAMITADAALSPELRRAHQKIDFSKAPNDLADADIMTTTRTYANLFWGRNPTDAETASVAQSVAKLKATSTATPAGTRQLLLALCVTSATSLDALTNP